MKTRGSASTGRGKGKGKAAPSKASKSTTKKSPLKKATPSKSSDSPSKSSSASPLKTPFVFVPRFSASRGPAETNGTPSASSSARAKNPIPTPPHTGKTLNNRFSEPYYSPEKVRKVFLVHSSDSESEYVHESLSESSDDVFSYDAHHRQKTTSSGSRGTGAGTSMPTPKSSPDRRGEGSSSSSPRHARPKVTPIDSMETDPRPRVYRDDEDAPYQSVRRSRKEWSDPEFFCLQLGLKLYGASWSLIHKTFRDVWANRSPVDLKDKARCELKARLRSFGMNARPNQLFPFNRVSGKGGDGAYHYL